MSRLLQRKTTRKYSSLDKLPQEVQGTAMKYWQNK